MRTPTETAPERRVNIRQAEMKKERDKYRAKTELQQQQTSEQQQQSKQEQRLNQKRSSSACRDEDHSIWAMYRALHNQPWVSRLFAGHHSNSNKVFL